MVEYEIKFSNLFDRTDKDQLMKELVAFGFGLNRVCNSVGTSI